MDMRAWVAELIARPEKKPLPILSFPAVQLMNISVRDLIGSADRQAEAMEAVAERLDTAASVSFMDLSVEAEAFGSRVVVSNEEVPTVVGSIVDEDGCDGLAIPEVGAGRTGLYLEAIERVSARITDRPVIAGTIGPFSLAGRLCDVSEVMILCYEEPELVREVLEKGTEFLAQYVGAYKQAGADGVLIAEPLAGLLSPSLAAEFSAPYVRRIVEDNQADDFAMMYHNCGGGIIQQIESILSTGAMGYHFGNAIDMADAAPLVPGDRLAMGNVDPAGQLRNGTPETVKNATLDVLESCACHPNFIISTGCDVPPMAPWANIDAFFEAVTEFYGR